MLTISVNLLEQTLGFGALLARCVADSPVRTILLRGELGSGKTTFTRAFVEALPGGMDAEISSPSFTVCNVYATDPPVLHCDLYRSPGEVPDEVLDALDIVGDPQQNVLTLIEWAEYLPQNVLPQEYLDIFLQSSKHNRSLTLRAHGAAAAMLIGRLQQELQNT